nr:TAXI family TRAP transporter solute-binding subunit [Natrinema versiforme]
MHNRRTFLAGIAGASALSIAGCMESSGSSVRMGTGTQGSATFAASQALQSVINDSADEVRISSQETSGSGAGNFRLYDNGEIDGGGFDNYASAQAVNNTGNFADRSVDSIPYQGFFYVLSHMYIVTSPDSDIETTDDLSGKNVWLNPAGTSVRPPTDAVFENAGLYSQINPVSVDRSGLPGAIEEGRIDAAVVYGANSKALPGWVTELDTRFNFIVVTPTESFKQAIRDTSGIGYEEVSTYGWEQDIGSDEVATWTLGAQFRFGDNVSTETVQTIARVTYEQNESIIEANNIFPEYEDPSDMMAAAISDQAVHPGVAEFLKEENQWNDELSIGET